MILSTRKQSRYELKFNKMQFYFFSAAKIRRRCFYRKT